MYLIVGLGNPGDRYKLTRHNIGFLVVDALGDYFKTPLSTEKFQAHFAKVPVGDNDVILAKPQTFMNLSGESVQALMAFYKVPPENLLIIHDEVDLPFAELKIQNNRGHAGHNGVRSVHEKIGPEYSRLRLGVGRPAVPQMAVADFVLQNFSPEQLEKLPEFIGHACDEVLDFVKAP
jgi:peptidyl-tRNA hydrolase, PTH1 family